MFKLLYNYFPGLCVCLGIIISEVLIYTILLVMVGMYFWASVLMFAGVAVTTMLVLSHFFTFYHEWMCFKMHRSCAKELL